ncbi:MAG: 30S ribosomal protein S2 [Acidimicrobiia bacterium]|nr:30S ribosomal protein S2 [Acidimicrobiia bacterium]
MAPVVTMSQLVEAGVHFGHQTRRWNPKMKRFIYGEISGIYIIDLKQTLARIEAAYSFVRDMVADGGTLLFVGTKKQIQPSVETHARRCGMPFVNQRWLGGTLTNIQTIFKRVHKMQEYQRLRDSGGFEAMPKKEALSLQRELAKLERNLGGIGKMDTPPEAVFVLDTKAEHIAVSEANKLGIPLIAVVDTNCDPDVVSYVIPGNDDTIRAGEIMCRIMSDAVIEGHRLSETRGTMPAAPQRTPEEEAEMARQQAEAAAAAAAEMQAREARVARTIEDAEQPGGAASGEDDPAPEETTGEAAEQTTGETAGAAG